MTPLDCLSFAFKALRGHRLRSALSLLGLTIGVAAVVLLTALGEGARLYVVDQFAGLGTNLLVIIPGKTETTGSFGVGGVPNDLTLDDALAVRRFLPEARAVAPITMATGELAAGERRRQVPILGTTPEYKQARRLKMAGGEFLPASDIDRGAPVVVLGATAARELFAEKNALGQPIRVEGRRMRVVGVLAKQGTKMGVNFDDIAIVPVAIGMQLFNRHSLFRILIQGSSHADLDILKEKVVALLTERHGEEDVTAITQDAMLDTFSAILGALTLALGAIAAISLTVAGIGIMNVMLVAVSERTSEVGLLKSLGAARPQILLVFLAEAAILSTLGGLLGMAVGFALVRVLVELLPALPARPPDWAVAASLLVSVTTGVVFGVLPARKATRLDPVAALAKR